MKLSKKILWTIGSLIIMVVILTAKNWILGEGYYGISAILGVPFGMFWSYIWIDGGR